MTIYVFSYYDPHETPSHIHEACLTYEDAYKAWRKALKKADTNYDMVLHNAHEAITKHVVEKPEDIVDMVNSLQRPILI